MKRAIKILALSVLLSTLLFYATANDSSDDSKFLMIDRSIDDTPVGEWVQPNKDGGTTASRSSNSTTTHNQARLNTPYCAPRKAARHSFAE
jgi:hypothetical protein